MGPQMKALCMHALLSAQNELIDRLNSFELYGCDFIVDMFGRVYLLEVNGGPQLVMDTPVHSKLIPEMLQDMVSLVLDREQMGSCHIFNDEHFFSQAECPERWGNFLRLKSDCAKFR